MTTYTYERITAQARRTITCPGCGKRRTITCTFRQTVNPFNKNDDGTVKTHQEVWQSVRAQADAWEPPQDATYHAKCIPGGDQT